MSALHDSRIQSSSGSDPDAGRSVYLTMVFTDLVESTRIKTDLGDDNALRIISRHHQLVRELLSRWPDAFEVDQTGDGFFLAFPTPSEAVLFALSLQAAHRDAGEEMPHVRVGIHAGEVVRRPAPSGSSKRWELIGLAVDQSARIAGLARGGQTLLSRVVFDNARQRLKGVDLDDPDTHIRWLAHGDYRLKGIEDSIGVCEVGIDGYSPLVPPQDSAKARREVLEGDEITLGWRPGVGLEVPHADRWTLREKLGEGGFGEVWRAEHRTTKDQRVFKFCFQADRLRSLKRELTLFRLIRERLGERPDITRIYDVQFDEAPFYLEMEYTEGGNIREWVEEMGGCCHVSLRDRLSIVRQVAEALAAAHSVGIVHKDVKPTNVLVHQSKDGRIQARLTDFGIGEVLDRKSLDGITLTGAGVGHSTLMHSTSSSGGTTMFMAPELLAGALPSAKSDIYSLGILFYQLIVEDFERPLSVGWERTINNRFLRKEIAACVEGDPDRRIGSAAHLAQRLRTYFKRRNRYVAIQVLSVLALFSLIFGSYRAWGAYNQGVARRAAAEETARKEVELREAQARAETTERISALTREILELSRQEEDLSREIRFLVREPERLESDRNRASLREEDRERINRLWNVYAKLEKQRERLTAAAGATPQPEFFREMLGEPPLAFAMFEPNLRMQRARTREEYIQLALDYEKIAEKYSSLPEPLIGQGVAFYRAGALESAKHWILYARELALSAYGRNSAIYANVLVMLAEILGQLNPDLSEAVQLHDEAALITLGKVRDEAVALVSAALPADSMLESDAESRRTERVLSFLQALKRLEEEYAIETDAAGTEQIDRQIVRLLNRLGRTAEAQELQRDIMVRGGQPALEESFGISPATAPAVPGNSASLGETVSMRSGDSGGTVNSSAARTAQIALHEIQAGNTMAVQLAARGERERALRKLEEVDRAAANRFGEEHPLTWRQLVAGAEVLSNLGDLAAAAERLAQAGQRLAKAEIEGLTNRDEFDLLLRQLGLAVSIYARQSGSEAIDQAQAVEKLNRDELAARAEALLPRLHEADTLRAKFHAIRAGERLSQGSWAGGLADLGDSVELLERLPAESSDTYSWLCRIFWVLAHIVDEPDRLEDVLELTRSLQEAMENQKLELSNEGAFLFYVEGYLLNRLAAAGDSAGALQRRVDAAGALERSLTLYFDMVLPKCEYVERLEPLYFEVFADIGADPATMREARARFNALEERCADSVAGSRTLLQALEQSIEQGSLAELAFF